METTHSKTRRTKGSAPKIVVPSWDEVWDSFKKNNVITSVEDMNSDGWKTIHQVSKEIKLSRSHINNLANEGKFETKKAKIFDGKKTREIVFIRPNI